MEMSRIKIIHTVTGMILNHSLQLPVLICDPIEVIVGANNATKIGKRNLSKKISLVFKSTVYIVYFK